MGTEASNRAAVGTGSTAPSRAQDRRGKGIPGFASSIAGRGSPSRVALETGGNVSSQVCDWEDAKDSRCKKSRTSVEKPDRPCPETRRVKPK